MERVGIPRLSVRIALLIGVLLMGENVEVAAQTIHKCINSDGHVAYQQTACAASMSAQIVEIAPSPVVAINVAKAETPAKPTKRVTTARARNVNTPVVYSFECTTRGGAIFYRHQSCPASIPRSGAPRSTSARARVETEAVRGQRMSRAEVCRRMRSVGRAGREHDQVTPTYERNLGHDPCRRY